AAPYFPLGTIHVGVVDPGVGSGRRKLLIETEEGFFIGPDNGLFSLALARSRTKRTTELTNTDFFLPSLSQTFHGRDVFAPVAAHLSLGTDPSKFGEICPPPISLNLTDPAITADSVSGEVIHIDRFGNLITNIKWDDILSLSNTEELTAILKDTRIAISNGSYSSVTKGTLTAITGSSGFLEIAVRDASAKEKLAAALGDTVSVVNLNDKKEGK
ncbi:MAG: SAM-dependent chlorinase/fluorinase, partial [bacterium]|nr:SAM-dependent chlorinase/fluorinase [bacterium]